MRWFVDHRPQYAACLSGSHVREGHEGRILAIVRPDELARLLAVMLDEAEFLSPYGLRSISAAHRDRPFVLDVDGTRSSVDYEPGESQSGLYGGNSNWRGPIWMPVNHLVVEALRKFARFYGDDLVVEHPLGSGRQCTLHEVADDLTQRLVALFARDSSGRRPVLGTEPLFQGHEQWRDNLPFHEYFHGDTGKGLGASHQTGWTGSVVDLLLKRGWSLDRFSVASNTR
jgi:hypothetical protein